MPIYQNGKEVTPKLNGKDLSRVMYNGKKIWPIEPIIISPSESQACDICLYDKANDKLIIVRNSMWNVESFPSSKYTPVGIVVVPGKHNVYGDGSCGVMSLKHMDCDTPSTGSTFLPRMYWGVYDTDISSLTNYNVVCHIGNLGNPQSTIQGTVTNAYLPSDRFDTVQCPHDTDAYYHYKDTSRYIPSPYLTNGERNPLYYQTTSPSSASNAMSDFDGIGNTEKLITQRGTKDYNSWKPTCDSHTDYPAASCCDMFYTEGTSQGDWYLPACGELGYIMPPFNKINEAIRNMRTAYGSSVGVELSSSTKFLYYSSTEYNSIYARTVDTQYGRALGGNKGDVYGYLVRAWLRVGGSK